MLSWRRGPTATAVLLAAMFLAALLTLPVAHGAPPTEWQDPEPRVLVENVNIPTDIHIAPDGSVWFTELAGNVSRFDPSTGEVEDVHHVEDVVTGVERGLMGLALAHDFSQTGAFYLYYTERTDDPDGGINRLVRVVDGQEQELVSLPAAIEHNGGRIVVAPNGTLFVGTGENSEHDPAQDPDSLLGKVLRMTPDGEPVAGNMHGLVYSLGHRNVYGLALDPDSGALWATENMGWRRDEINIVEPGGNYGYPECEGHHLHGVDDPCPTDKGYTFPIQTFYEDRAAAPTGATFWQDGFYWGSFNEGSIHHTWEGSDGWNDTIVYDHAEEVFDLHVGPDDALYFAASDGIWRMGFGEAGGGGTGGADGGDGTGPTGVADKGIGAASTGVAVAAVAAAAAMTGRRRR